MASSDLHRVIGTWAFIFNLLIFLSGIYIQRKFFVEKWWDKYTKTENLHEKHLHKITYPLSTVSLDSLGIVARKILPVMHFQGFSIDCGDGGTISVFGTHQESVFQAYDNFVAVDFDSSGKYVSVNYTPWKNYKTADKFTDINFSLFHTGWALGTPGKIIWCLMGFTPAFLSITGFMLWWRRKKKRKINQSTKNNHYES